MTYHELKTRYEETTRVTRSLELCLKVRKLLVLDSMTKEKNIFEHQGYNLSVLVLYCKLQIPV